MQTFTLDLKTLLQILSRQKQQGLLQTDIPPNKLRTFRIQQALQAKLFLENGIVYTCFIETQSGERISEGQDALQFLLNLGIIKWYWIANAPQPPASLARREAAPEPGRQLNSYSLSLDFIPRRTSRGEEDLQILAREYRKILALIDGHRSVHKLATILSMKEEEVIRVLQQLQARGMIF